jgi:hypothetical protein
MRMIRIVRLTLTLYICLVCLVSANAQLPVCSDQGTWSTETFSIGADTVQITDPRLLTDGRVMVQYRGGLSTGHPWQDWYALTPSESDCYGLKAADCGGGPVARWSALASIFPTIPKYGPGLFASAVLPSGNVIIEGGEDNLGTRAESTGGAYYNAAANTWTNVLPPSGWTTIGDAPSVVLADGTFMLGNACGNPGGTGQTALLDEASLTWTNTSGQPQEWTAESSFTLLPGGSVLTVGTCWPGQACTTVANSNNYMLYDPTLGTWSSPGNTPARLYSKGSGFHERNSCFSGGPIFGEQGPAALLPNGTYFATGGFVKASNAVFTSVFNVATQTWSSSPPLPSVTVGGVVYQLSAEDQGSVVLRDGNYLFPARPRDNAGYHGPANYIEWNGNFYCQLNNVPVGIPTQTEMLTLPTGQIFIAVFAGAHNSYFIYTPGGTIYPGIAPTLTSLSATTLLLGGTYTATGTQFNGATQSSFLGDDFQDATNYPLVRITNNQTGNVFYAKTHNPSTMGVATGNLVTTTLFDVPSSAETGLSTLVVVTNGIPSNALNVTVKP